MHHCTGHRHSIYCILPPHMIRNIALNGTAKQRLVAMKTIGADMTFRTLRASVAQLPSRPAPRVAALMGEADKQRLIYSAKNSETLPGTLVRSEGQGATKDVAVNEAYDGLGATYDMFWSAFDRNSIDDEGLPLEATVHYGRQYDNAFWNGERMVFGDGDGELFNRFTISLDVIGHELTHGVTEDEAKLTYLYQPGALNESISDVFGSLVKQYKLKQTAAKADWLIGEGLVHSEGQRCCAAFDESAGHCLRRPGVGQGSAACAYEELRAHQRGQRRRAHQFRHSEPRVLSGRHRPRWPCLGKSRTHLVRNLARLARTPEHRLHPLRALDRAGCIALVWHRQR